MAKIKIQSCIYLRNDNSNRWMFAISPDIQEAWIMGVIRQRVRGKYGGYIVSWVGSRQEATYLSDVFLSDWIALGNLITDKELEKILYG